MDFQELSELAQRFHTKGKVTVRILDRKELSQVIAAMANQNEACALTIEKEHGKQVILCVLPQSQRKCNKEDIGNAARISIGLLALDLHDKKQLAGEPKQ